MVFTFHRQSCPRRVESHRGPGGHVRVHHGPGDREQRLDCDGLGEGGLRQAKTLRLLDQGAQLILRLVGVDVDKAAQAEA
jgi:hypothetical protein